MRQKGREERQKKEKERGEEGGVKGIQQDDAGLKKEALLAHIISLLPRRFLPPKSFTPVALQSVTSNTNRRTNTHTPSCHSTKLGQWQRFTGVTSKVPIVSITLVQHWHLFSI